MLKEPYTPELARLIVREMTELLVLDLVRKYVVTKKLTLTVGYDRTSIEPDGTDGSRQVYRVTKTGLEYTGKLVTDPYGRVIPQHAHGTGNLGDWTSSTQEIVSCMMALYDRIIDPDLLVRRVQICACGLIPENRIPEEEPVQLELFTDYEALERQQAEKKAKREKEKALQRATLHLQDKFGKNAVLKGMNLVEGATAIERNGQIGGHRAGGEEA